MSTRAHVSFNSNGQRHALIYRHCDGYPEGLGADLLAFFEEVIKQTADTRFTDPEYLAAKWIVWDSGCEGRLDFLSVGISLQEHSDIEYLYDVDCDGTHDTPIVSYKNCGETVYLNYRPIKYIPKLYNAIEFKYNGTYRTLINYETDSKNGLISGFECETEKFKNFRLERTLHLKFVTKLF